MPSHRIVQMKDQNCDGALDLIFMNQGVAIEEPTLTICYGNPELDVPDTNDCVTIEFYQKAGGHWASLLDVTGDNVLDLVLSGSDSRYYVYVGEPGARIDSIFGSGNDPADPEKGRNYARPWGTTPMPNRVNEAWGNPNKGPIYELGDVDLDGADDIVAFTSGYLCVWRVVNIFDSLIDGYIDVPALSVNNLQNLGDIDSTGIPTYALSYFTSGGHPLYAGAVSFYKPNPEIPKTGRFRQPAYPIDAGDRCYGISSVKDDSEQQKVFDVRVTPNPASGDLVIEWESSPSGTGAAQAYLMIADVRGGIILSQKLHDGQEQFLWHTGMMQSGVYYITLTVGGVSRTVPVTIQQ